MAVLIPHIRALSAPACCLALVLLGGCRNLDNAQVDVLERELRQQEDYIYELEDYLIEYSEKLRQARLAQCPPGAKTTSGGTTRPRAPLPEPTIDEDLIDRPSLPLNGRSKITPRGTEAPPAAESVAPHAESEAPASDTPAVPEPELEPVDPESLEAPELEIGPVGAVPSEQTPVAASATAPQHEEAEGPLLIPDPVDYLVDSEMPSTEQPADAQTPAASEPELAAPQVNAPRLAAQELKIRRVFSEPDEEDKSAGSLLVVVEAVNVTDEPVDAIGAASLMIMARDDAGDLKRVERWDFTAEETAAAWQSSHLGDGLHLELPLTKSDLPEGELELWARVVDDGGAKLLTSADDPYRFEADKLVAISEANPKAALAATDEPSVQQLGAEDAPAKTPPATSDADAAKTAVAEGPQPQWRASSTRLGKDRVEGFATTVGNKPASWTTKPIDGAQPRVASTTAKSGPIWKRSSRAAAATDAQPEWGPER